MEKHLFSKLSWLDMTAEFHKREAEKFASLRQNEESVQSEKTARWYAERASISRRIERVITKGTFTSL